MANFDLSIPKILANEGGYQVYEEDQGNYNSQNELIGTNWGISAPTFEKWKGSVPTKADMQNMAQSTAIAIYKRYYWDAYNIGLINDQYLADHILDLYVNSSPNAAGTIIQKAINDVPPFFETVDGIMGKNTRGTINKISANGKASDLNTAIVNERKTYLNSLGSGVFNSGWINRANAWLDYSAPSVVVQSSGYGFALLICFGLYLMYKNK